VSLVFLVVCLEFSYVVIPTEVAGIVFRAVVGRAGYGVAGSRHNLKHLPYQVEHRGTAILAVSLGSLLPL